MNRNVTSVMNVTARSRSLVSNLPVAMPFVEHPLGQLAHARPVPAHDRPPGLGRGAIDVEQMRVVAQQVAVGPRPGLEQPLELVVGRIGRIRDGGDQRLNPLEPLPRHRVDEGGL